MPTDLFLSAISGIGGAPDRRDADVDQGLLRFGANQGDTSSRIAHACISQTHSLYMYFTPCTCIYSLFMYFTPPFIRQSDAKSIVAQFRELAGHQIDGMQTLIKGSSPSS